ncbi:dATP/dGTP diphosphohydrolase domain-containing protein [Bradyrhizobium sp. Ec3.3]|uniref:dATP/dGTP diphosphohydrolase domain-containing protein n=1 Tax=Bradyrhizobium sp. Ec3.3 TaxID=189753 RepID=UPI0006867973|nr:dATP/dGTP diphosphohydrolase domain-containing protein [Bradyrhizobium sp. Ec3.3]
MSKAPKRYDFPHPLADRDREELAAGYPLRPAPSDAPFELQRDSGDEQAERYHAHDQASRERDALATCAHTGEACDCEPGQCSELRGKKKGRVVPTNTPRPGETPEQIAARSHTRVMPEHPPGDYASGGFVKGVPEHDALTTRHTFTIPSGHVAVTDAEGRATGEVRLKPWPQVRARIHGGASQTFAEPAAAPEHDATTKTEPTNPKDAFGILKASLTYVSFPVLMETAIGMAEGGFKYGAHNYRARGVRASVYVDATIRHVFQFWEGEDIDAESGAKLSHVTKAIASLTVLRDSMIRGNWIDDRPPPSPKRWLQSISAMMLDLAKKFPEPVARYLADGKRGPGRILENGE